MADEKKGMLRHVDILGRVVIPREVRKALRINYGDLMEFSALSNKQVVMRKFHLINEISGLFNVVVNLARLKKDIDIIIVDTERVVCFNGERQIPKGELGEDVLNIIRAREEKVLDKEFKITSDFALRKESLILPIISGGDVLGGIIIDKEEKEMADLIANFVIEYFAN